MAALPAQVMSAAEHAAESSVSQLKSEVEVAMDTMDELKQAARAQAQETKMLAGVQVSAQRVATADISSLRTELESFMNLNSPRSLPAKQGSGEDSGISSLSTTNASA